MVYETWIRSDFFYTFPEFKLSETKPIIAFLKSEPPLRVHSRILVQNLQQIFSCLIDELRMRGF